MTTQKPEEQKSRIVVLNQGQMTYTMRPGPNGEPRILEPGSSIETLDDQEAKDLLDYHTIVDAAKVMPAAVAESKKLQARIKELTEENAELRKQLGASAPVASNEPASPVSATPAAKKSGKKG